MPLHLESLDLSDRLQGCTSVLFVSCPVCPAASLASDNDSPLVEFFKHGIKTPAFEDLLQAQRKSLESGGIRTGVFTSYLPCPTTCMWTAGQHRRLRKRAEDFDVAVVMGCESAHRTVEDALDGTNCEAILGMQLVGITNAKLKFEFPLNIKLESPIRVDANPVR